MKRSMTFALFYIGMAALLVARTLQRFYMIDTATGFFNEGFEQAGTVVTVVSLAFAVVLMIMMRLSVPDKVQRPKESRPVAIGSLCAAAGLFISAVTTVLKSQTKSDIVLALLSVAFAGVMALNAVSLKNGTAFHPSLSLTGIIYCLLRLILSFTGYISEITVADSVFNTFTMCMLLLFFTADAKVIHGLEIERLPADFYGSGLAAALFCVIEVVPVLMALVMEVEIHGSSVPDFSYAGFAVYILVNVFTLSSSAEQNAE